MVHESADALSIPIVETGPSALPEYGGTPSVFTVREVMDVVAAPGSPGGVRLVPRVIDQPYVKDYDAPPALSPSRWSDHFEVTHWGFLAARLEGDVVGRAAIAWRTPGLDLGEGRDDLGVLWDLRVRRSGRRQGVGAALFRAAEKWAVSRGARMLKVETQNINVPACRLYEAMGCVIGEVDRDAYPDLPHEVQILWYRDLADEQRALEHPSSARSRRSV